MKYLLLFLAVISGYLIASIFSKKIKNLGLYLAFSGAFLLSITVFELLPEVYETDIENIGWYIMGGIVLQIFLEFLSKGAEHGHVHLHSSNKRFPVLLFISLGIHALLEGFPIHEHNDLLIAILIHKIPVAIILSYFFIQANYKKSITLIFMILFALMTPLGSFIMDTVPQFQKVAPQITGIAIGIFLHISTTILFESSKNHKFNLAKIVSILLAIFLAALM